MSHPTSVELLQAVQLFLKEAEGALSGRLAFHAKVAGNALATVAREIEANPDQAEYEAFEALGGVTSVCEALREGRLATDDKQLLVAVRQGVLARLAVDNPRYATYERLRQRDI